MSVNGKIVQKNIADDAVGRPELLASALGLRFFSSVQNAGGLAPGSGESGKIFPVNASLGNIAVTLPNNPGENYRIGFLLTADTGSAFDITLTRSGSDTILHRGTLGLTSFTLGKRAGDYCELVFRTVGGVLQWVVVHYDGDCFYAGRYSGQVAVGGASPNAIWANTLPSVTNSRITHNVSTGAFTVLDKGQYEVSMHLEHGGNSCEGRFQSPALLTPNPAAPGNNVHGRVLQVNGFSGESQSATAQFPLNAGGTFDIRAINFAFISTAGLNFVTVKRVGD